MRVTENSSHHMEHEGKSFYFCSTKCLGRFRDDPEKYLDPTKSEEHTTPHETATTYTCPMHPEILKDHPGTCPKCGMAREPLMPRLDEDKDPELKELSRRLGCKRRCTVILTLHDMVC